MPEVFCDAMPKRALNASAGGSRPIFATSPTPAAAAAVAAAADGRLLNNEDNKPDNNSNNKDQDSNNCIKYNNDEDGNESYYSRAGGDGPAGQSAGAVARGRLAIGRLLKKFSFSVFPAADGHSDLFVPYDETDDRHYGYYSGDWLAELDYDLPYAQRYNKRASGRLSTASDQGAVYDRRHHGSVGGCLNASSAWAAGNSTVASSACSSAVSLFAGAQRNSSSGQPVGRSPAASLSPGDALFFSQRRATCAIIDSHSNRYSPTSYRRNNNYCHNRHNNKRNGGYANLNDNNNANHNSNRTRLSACGCDAKRQLAFGFEYCCNGPHAAARPRAVSSAAVQPPQASISGPASASTLASTSEPAEKTGQRSSSFYALPAAAAAAGGGAGSGSSSSGVVAMLPPVTSPGAFSAPASGSLHVFSPNGGASVFNFVEPNGAIDDDREFDNRNVMHYELGFYEKTFATDCFRGTLTFQLRYDFIHRALMLHVMRASNLSSPEDPPDPYVKMYCLPERRHHGKTRIFKHTCDADFNEVFSFDVPYCQLADRMLQFTVYNFDRFTRHGLIGNVIMRDVFEKSELYNWTEYTMQIVGSQEKNDFGDLLLYIAYSLHLRRLYVTVSKAYNLRPMDITGASDPYVKVEQIHHGRRLKMRKTSIKRANLNPVYHECLEFDVLPDQLEETNLLFQVMDWDRIGRDDLLGCCVLGRESTTRQGRQQWEQLCHTALRSFATPPLIHTTTVADHRRSQSPEANNAENSAPSPSYGVNGQCVNGVNGDGATASPLPPCLATHKCSIIPQSIIGPQRARAIGTWHSILGEVPETFRNIPKAKK